MRKKIINTCLLASFGLLPACAEQATVIPPGVMSREKFTKVLVDFALAESAATMNIKDVPVYRTDSTYAFDPLKENHVSRAGYDSTLAFYSEHTDLYKEIYQDVLSRISDLQTHHDSLRMHPVSK